MASVLMLRKPLGEELGIGAVQGRDERLQAALLHDGRAGLPDLQDFEHGLALRPDLAHEVVKIACRVMRRSAGRRAAAPRR